MTTRRAFISALAGGLLAGPRIADAQQAAKVYRVGYLTAGSVTANPRVLEAFRQGLRELGWVEGQNLVIEYRSAEGRFDRLPELAAELVRLKVDVIVAAPTPGALAAKKATATVPIVGVSLTEPVGVGLIASLARPGGNVTGVAYSVGTDIFGKDLALLKEVVPKVRRVAVLSNPDGPVQPLTISNVKAAARSLGLELQLVEARGPGDFDRAFAAMAKERVGALFVVTDPVFIPHRARLVSLAAKSRLPSIFTQRADVEAGGLLSYGPSFADMYRRAAAYVDKILKGARPADLPVEQPTKFELVINLKTAKALGLTIPPSLLQRADEVIQ
ncbi:MAG TPA: ABC transporter substrate-binding protein [Thermoanaerobaculia bacterium]|nr:ABC transporter substrate-binding protein [Thermoanaerobaculia bacterium]